MPGKPGRDSKPERKRKGPATASARPNGSVARAGAKLLRVLGGPRGGAPPVLRCGLRDAEVLIDRAATLVEVGRMVLLNDNIPVDSVHLSANEFLLLMEGLFPEHFPQLRAAAFPTDTHPGTDERLAVYALRAATGQELYHPRDASATTSPETEHAAGH